MAIDTKNPDLADATVEIRVHDKGYVVYIEREVEGKDGVFSFEAVAVSDFVWPTQEAARRVAKLVGTAMGFNCNTNSFTG